MKIQHNMSAIKAGNNFNLNVSGLKKSTQKLSTGLGINSASDNASGLAVSEKLRGQIRGLSKAAKNANDGISLMQTAEGGLGEIHSALQRMRDLSVQSANGTYTDSDREKIQLEIEALKKEVGHISESTEYNGIKLLNGEAVLSAKAGAASSLKLNNEFGAKYGSINYNMAIGGGKILVTADTQDVYLEFTTGASGKGGENAVWGYDTVRTGGDLNKHITINLVKGEAYTDKQIQALIDNASVPKALETSAGRVTFKSETGVIYGANNPAWEADPLADAKKINKNIQTFSILRGNEKQAITSNNFAQLTQYTVNYTKEKGTFTNRQYRVQYDRTGCLEDNPAYPKEIANPNYVEATHKNIPKTIEVNNPNYKPEKDIDWQVKDSVTNTNPNDYTNTNLWQANPAYDTSIAKKITVKNPDYQPQMITDPNDHSKQIANPKYNAAVHASMSETIEVDNPKYQEQYMRVDSGWTKTETGNPAYDAAYDAKIPQKIMVENPEYVSPTIPNPNYKSGQPQKVEPQNNPVSPTPHPNPTASPAKADVRVNGNTIILTHGATYTQDEILNALRTANANLFKYSYNLHDTLGTDLVSAGSVTRKNMTIDNADAPIDNMNAINNLNTLDNTEVIIKFKKEYEVETRKYYGQLNVRLDAQQYGSYAEYKTDESKYKQPDCVEYFNTKALQGVEWKSSDSQTDPVSLSIANDKLVITLKAATVPGEAYNYQGNASQKGLQDKINNFLEEQGYKYTATVSSSWIPPQQNETWENGVFERRIRSSSVYSTLVLPTKSSTQSTIAQTGSRYLKKGGTAGGVRQVIGSNTGGNLADLTGSATGMTRASDSIAFTANTYGASSDYKSLVNAFKISTTKASEGKESVTINRTTNDKGEDVTTATINLSTGVRYSQSDIEKLVKDAGFNYSVSLGDIMAPDGANEGYIYFTKQGEVNIAQTQEGAGVGIDDVFDTSDKLTFQIGANGGEDQEGKLKIEDSRVEKLGIAEVDVSTRDKANKAIAVIDEAIKVISLRRADIGAMQNRFEHAVQNLTESNAGLNSAESEIRDTDMAKEMTNYTKNDILKNASQSILAQAGKEGEQMLRLLA